ncbi:zinc-ribbon domain-containing protein [Robiginitalea sp.]|nr:zinc-ribbon domain-containing protein [Robiginitalea sp.]
MILFFGTRTGTSKSTTLKDIRCPFCRQSDTLVGYTTPHFVHLFWIPVYRLPSIAEIQCTHCKKVYSGNEISPEMKHALAPVD